jgi:hypothetical protein
MLIVQQQHLPVAINWEFHVNAGVLVRAGHNLEILHFDSDISSMFVAERNFNAIA